MSTVYVPTPVALTPITIPSDGDGPIKAADVNVPFEALADAIAYADAPDADFTRSVAGPYQILDDTIWSASSALTYTQDSVASAGTIVAGLELPNGSTLKTATCWLDPAAGHSNLPAAMPALTIGYVELSTGGVIIIDSQTDLSGSVGTYQATHVISITGMTHTVDTNLNRYFIRFSGEGSTDSVAGLKFYGARVVYHVDETDKGAS